MWVSDSHFPKTKTLFLKKAYKNLFLVLISELISFYSENSIRLDTLTVGQREETKQKNHSPMCPVTESKFNYSSVGFSELQEQLSNGTVY